MGDAVSRLIELARRLVSPYPPSTWLPRPPPVSDRGEIRLSHRHSAVDGFYTGCLVLTPDGTFRRIVDYDGSRRVAHIWTPWYVEPFEYLVVT